MPNYEKHLTAAARAAVVVAFGSFAVLFWVTSRVALAGLVAFLTALSVLVGGQAPDIDSNSSVPRRRFNRLIQTMLVVALPAGVYYGHTRFLGFTQWWVERIGLAVTTSYALGLSVGIAVVIGVKTIPEVVQRVMPTHRGPVHSIPFWFVTATGVLLVLVAAFREFRVPPLVRWSIGTSIASGLLIGVAVHISKDDEVASFLEDD